MYVYYYINKTLMMLFSVQVKDLVMFLLDIWHLIILVYQSEPHFEIKARFISGPD